MKKMITPIEAGLLTEWFDQPEVLEIYSTRIGQFLLRLRVWAEK